MVFESPPPLSSPGGRTGATRQTLMRNAMAVARAHSKKQLRKAGRLLRDLRPGSRPVVPDDFWEAVEIIEWWRAQHARPLGRVNAGLRYYVRKANAEPDVTQRLKRFSTIVDKLRREPTMQLDTMEDIAGVRAVLPAQEPGRLRG
jgi:putative GTP pyrophosphokinase